MNPQKLLHTIIDSAEEASLLIGELEQRINELESENDDLSNELADLQYRLSELEGLHD